MVLVFLAELGRLACFSILIEHINFVRIFFIDANFAFDEFVILFVLLDEIYFEIRIQKLIYFLQIYELTVRTTDVSQIQQGSQERYEDIEDDRIPVEGLLNGLLPQTQVVQELT